MKDNNEICELGFTEGNFELKVEGKTKAMLKFMDKKKESAEITIDNQKWLLGRKGFWNPFVVIENLNDDKEIGKINFGLNRFRLDSVNYSKYFQLKNTKFWKDIWTWIDNSGNELMDIIPSISTDKIGYIQIKKDSETDNFMYWIATLGWYLVLTNRHDCWTFSAQVDYGL